MGGRFSTFVFLGVFSLACGGTQSPTAVSPTPTPTPFPSPGACFGNLADLNPEFPEALVRDGAACPGIQYAEERHCPGVFIAVAQGDRLISNSIRYYDGNRRLFAARFSTDINSYCNGRSFDIIYGTLPRCPTAEIVTNLCR